MERLPNSLEFLDRAERKLAELQGARGHLSDYKLAHVLGVTTAAVSGWRTGRCGMSDSTGLKIAAILGEPEAFVLVCLQAEKQRKNVAVRRAWERMISAIATVLLVVCLFSFYAPPAAAAMTAAMTENIHYAHERWRRWLRDFLRFLNLFPVLQ